MTKDDRPTIPNHIPPREMDKQLPKYPAPQPEPLAPPPPPPPAEKKK